ncbi:MAG: riboflavin synthase [Candidatus Nanopelagicales bacterium]
MFTGIVEELGEIVAVTELPGDALRLEIRGPLVTGDARLGDSIAVNGVCLTVTSIGDGTFSADVMRETLRRSSLREAAPGTRVNLERPLTLAARLGGHLVQGHVDGTGLVLSRERSDHWEVVRIGIPEDLARYVVEKGSIAVDGVSLTVADVWVDTTGHWLSVSLIPTTLAVTTLGERAVGETVNLEVDVVAKYVERLSGFGTGS